MEQNNNTQIPLHRRFNEREALKAIRNRYRKIKSLIPTQIKVLQEDSDFRSLCAELYQEGYKDWVIVSAIFNSVLTWRANEMKITYGEFETICSGDSMKSLMKDAVFEPERFTEEAMRIQIS